MADKQDNDEGGTKATWQSLLLSTIGTVLGLASFFTILSVMLMNMQPQGVQPLADGELSPAERIRQQQTEDYRTLTSYELIDKEQGVWRIPIDVAMEKMIAEDRAHDQ